MDGIYMSRIKTPMGEVNGKLILKVQGNSLSGTIEALGMKSDFTGGKVVQNKCQFSGVIRTMMGNISYEANGELKGNVLKVMAKTNMGNFEFTGERK